VPGDIPNRPQGNVFKLANPLRNHDAHHEDLLTLIIVEWIPDQRAMVCRNPGSLGYSRAEEYLHTRLYNCAWPFRRRSNKR
jgi:hypothetical protein